MDTKSSKEIMLKVGDNKGASRPEAYEIHLYSRRGDRVGYGAASTKAGSEHKGLRRCVGAERKRGSGEGN